MRRSLPPSPSLPLSPSPSYPSPSSRISRLSLLLTYRPPSSLRLSPLSRAPQAGDQLEPLPAWLGTTRWWGGDERRRPPRRRAAPGALCLGLRLGVDGRARIPLLIGAAGRLGLLPPPPCLAPLGPLRRLREDVLWRRTPAPALLVRTNDEELHGWHGQMTRSWHWQRLGRGETKCSVGTGKTARSWHWQQDGGGLGAGTDND